MHECSHNLVLSKMGDSDARCNPIDSIGSSRESRVSHSVSKGQRRLGEKEYRALQ
jgi:hypothetical protein